MTDLDEQQESIEQQQQEAAQRSVICRQTGGDHDWSTEVCGHEFLSVRVCVACHALQDKATDRVILPEGQ